MTSLLRFIPKPPMEKCVSVSLRSARPEVLQQRLAEDFGAEIGRLFLSNSDVPGAEPSAKCPVRAPERSPGQARTGAELATSEKEQSLCLDRRDSLGS